MNEKVTKGMRMKSICFRLLVFSSVMFGLILPAPMALAQVSSTTATITGAVTDQTGASISGANVTLSNPATGATYHAVSNADGSYTISAVKPGPGYTLTVDHSGFSTVTITGMYMNVGATRVQNAKMPVSATQQTVKVSAATQNVTLDTTDATIGNNFQVQFLNDLPILDRGTPAALFTQQPGTTLDGAVTGARVDQSRVILDGLDVNDMAVGDFGAIIGNAPVDSVQEFRGVVAGQLSSAGAGGGGKYELVTKSGTNQFHGAVVEYHRDTDLEANDWFNNNSIPTTPRPPLIRNQFGGNVGGPIWRNRVFFFFDYDGRRDTQSILVNRTVPLDSFRNGNIVYINGAGTNSELNSAQVAALDPLHIGFNPAILSLLSSRYPHSNNLSTGDTINTGGFQFNAPAPLKENNFVQRVDWNINSNMKLDGVGHFTRENATEASIQFPGDPQTSPFLDDSYSWVVQHTWSIGTNKVNQATYGETVADLSFPIIYNPQGINQYETFGDNGSGGAFIDSPYRRAINAQGRTYPIPLVRDDFNWLKGNHSFNFGGSFKWPSPNEYAILNYNTPMVGLSGNTLNLTSALRPADIGGGGAPGLYDPAFAFALGVITSVGSTYYYNNQGHTIPQGTPQTHHYRYYNTDLYFGDTWKVTPTLTLSYGLKWQYYSVPYDRDGLESIAVYADHPSQQVDFNTYFGDRVAQSASGTTGNLAVPLIGYVLGGKANHAPGYYKPDWKDWSPTFAFAFNPSSASSTVFSGGAGIIYDETVTNAVQYQQSQYSYLFQAQTNNLFGVSGNPVESFKVDPRFTGIGSGPAPAPAPAITEPFLPYVAITPGGPVPEGLALGQFNEGVDSNLKTPYSIQFNFGVQHEFAHAYIAKVTYVGRLGRRLLAQADASQLIDFPDQKSGQLMSQAFGNLSLQARKGVAVPTPQPWFENILPPGLGAALGFGNNTNIVYDVLGTLVYRGDFADTMQALANFGLLPPNVGMDAQFAENTFYTNKGKSSYNGLLLTLHKNLNYGLQFDINYTWSKSLDNVSVTANTPALGGYGFLCDVLRPNECYSPSDFDVTNYLTGNFIYALPIGRGARFGSNMPLWLDELVGGWEVSGIPTWHTGEPYFATSNAFVAGFANDAPAILTGNINDMKFHLTGGKGVAPNAFANAAKALADYTGPIGFQIGARNNLRGPHYFDLDLGLGKTFPIYRNLVFKFRADAFNALNHTNFTLPTVDITQVAGPFGQIPSTVTGTEVPLGGGGARVLQVAGRIEF